jgi:hypothetical protein
LLILHGPPESVIACLQHDVAFDFGDGSNKVQLSRQNINQKLEHRLSTVLVAAFSH